MKQKTKLRDVEKQKQVIKEGKEAKETSTSNMAAKQSQHKGVLNPVTINEYMDRSTQEVLDSFEDDGSSYSRDDINLMTEYEGGYQRRKEIMEELKEMAKIERKENPSVLDKIKKSFDTFADLNIFSKFRAVKEQVMNKKELIDKRLAVKKAVVQAEQKIKEKEERKDDIRKRLAEVKQKQVREQKVKKQFDKYKLKNYLSKAGITLDSKLISKRVFDFAVFVNLVISIYVIYFFSVNYNYTLYYAIINMMIMWTVIFAALLVMIWLAFHIILDLRIFQRKVSIESVLPDFLQLTSANIRAGMPIDQSLWYAVRSRFGILAKEIETVAKETMSGVELKQALLSFTEKYDSDILKRSFNLLIEGMDAGGEVGDLLNKISLDITESNILKKEMAANVTTYVIFIGFATLIAAPFLFSLSYQLLNIMTSLTANVAMPTGSFISFTGTGITPADFRIYSVLSLMTTAIFSAMIISVIKRGNIKEGLSSVPKFVAVCLFVYFISSWILTKAFANLI